MDESERNKQIVERLFKEVMDVVHQGPGAGKPNIELLDELVHEDYIEHNGLGGQGRAAAREFIENVIPNFEDNDGLFKSPVLKVNLIADGDLVVRQEVRKDFMIVDIMRIEDGLIREHWEAWHFEPGTPRPSYMKS